MSRVKGKIKMMVWKCKCEIDLFEPQVQGRGQSWKYEFRRNK